MAADGPALPSNADGARWASLFNRQALNVAYNVDGAFNANAGDHSLGTYRFKTRDGWGADAAANGALLFRLQVTCGATAETDYYLLRFTDQWDDVVDPLDDANHPRPFGAFTDFPGLTTSSRRRALRLRQLAHVAVGDPLGLSSNIEPNNA